MSLEPSQPEDVNIPELAKRAAARRSSGISTSRLNAIVGQALSGAERWRNPHSGEEFLISLGRYSVTAETTAQPNDTDTNKEEAQAEDTTTEQRQHFLLALLRDPNDASVTYVVDMRTAAPHPHDALFQINDIGVSFASDWHPDNGTFLNNEQVLEIVQQISLDTQQKRQWRNKRRRDNIIGGAFAVAIVAIMIGCIAAIGMSDSLQQSLDQNYTTQAIRDGVVVQADGTARVVPWSEQYDILSVKGLVKDTASQIPASGPRRISPASRGCTYVTRDIREGQRFAVVYKGTREDEFTVAVDADANHVEVCRTKGDTDNRNDKVIIQRVA